MESLSSDLGVLQKKIVSFAFETLIAVQISLACVITMTGLLLQDTQTVQILIGIDQSFPLSELHKKAPTEAKDDSDTEDDDNVDEAEADEPEEDAGDEDFSGDEKDDGDDDDGGTELDPAANGNQGSDDEDDDDGEDDDDDDDDNDEEEEEEDDEDDD